jgi:hypothetical protein
VDNYPGPGYGNVYLAWTDFTNNFEPTSSNNGTYFTRSSNDGLTWGPSGGVPIVNSAIDKNEVSHGAFVAVGPDHTVYVFYWGYGYQSGAETELMRKSTDYGKTFGPQVIVATLRTRSATFACRMRVNRSRNCESLGAADHRARATTASRGLVLPRHRRIARR